MTGETNKHRGQEWLSQETQGQEKDTKGIQQTRNHEPEIEETRD